MLRNIREYFNLKIVSKNSIIETPLKLRGAKYINLGNNVKLRKNYRIECIDVFAKQQLKPKFQLGDNVIINYNFTAFVTDDLIIGDNSIIASNVLITTENHGMDLSSTIPYANQPLVSNAVKIGSNVWIGQNVVILPGVEIGDNVIIGAGSVVTKSINNNCIVAGNPAKIIKVYDNNQKKWCKI
ncbi:MAG: hypothetical protein E7215_04315 [Clostridium sulfidigenes]|uniref:Acetyltransferase n=1 Tax=Clostridium sulfidigenes TaxID=318464 RepID=A0A927ZI75_9CLOT|nr:hypothetical protein [Clostridium sulfidigenes]